MPRKKTEQKNNIVVYQAKSGAIELRGDIKKETVWATQKQIAEAFEVNIRTVNEHIKNIFKTNELKENSVIRNFRITATDGKLYNTQHCNLDMILSVGYRVNSKKATMFRKWATKTLHTHITKGYTLNRKRIGKNYESFVNDIEKIQALLPENITYDPKDILELIKSFADTWVSLDAYDKETLEKKGASSKSIKLTAEELTNAITTLKKELMKKGEATEIFAQEKGKYGVEGIVGNVMQSFDGKNVYLTIEEKAAHLLYFMVKNHPFTDGNKRSGAFAFIWFLTKVKARGIKKINSAALTVLTILIAESKPKEKDKMLSLVISLLARK